MMTNQGDNIFAKMIGDGRGLLHIVGLALIFRKLPLTNSLWQSLLLSGISGFGAAIGIHYYIGYTDLIHLGPAWLGLIIFTIGIVGTRKMTKALKIEEPAEI